MMRRLLNLALGVWLLATFQSGMAIARDITIGYQEVYDPYVWAVQAGQFEKATGKKIDWRKFDSGAKVIAAMASGAVDIALLGSSPIAAGASKGLDAKLFWITEGIRSAEALVVRNGSGIIGPQDLKGHKLAVAFLSTNHFSALAALEQFGIDPKDVEVLNLQPSEIVAAWERGDIDAAYLPDPQLGEAKRSGKVLIDSGQLCNWGKCTFDGLLVMNKFADENPGFMKQFVKTLDSANEAYRRNPSAWTANSPEVQAIASITGGRPEDIPGTLASYVFPTLTEQASCKWLGCGKDGGAPQGLYFTSKFLKDQKKIDSVLPDYKAAVTDRWVRAAMQ
jgi:taurine transport system substrate-binding protein